MDTIVIAGAGGFIGGHLVQTLKGGKNYILAVDKKPVGQWWQRAYDPRVNNICADLSDPQDCKIVCRGAHTVYNLAADMGGMGFIERNRVACMRNVLINTNLLEAAWRGGAERYFFASSACVYPGTIELPLEEKDAYPAACERGYGWEKLYGEMLCQEYTAERDMQTYIARFHNVYGPNGSWNDGREKAPAALCRKIAYETLTHPDEDAIEIDVWGDGKQMRTFMYIDDCIEGILRIVDSSQLVATPINLGSSRLISIVDLAKLIGNIVNKTVNFNFAYGPLGVHARSSDNDLIQDVLGWQPSIPLETGLLHTYRWIEDQMRCGGYLSG